MMHSPGRPLSLAARWRSPLRLLQRSCTTQQGCRSLRACCPWFLPTVVAGVSKYGKESRFGMQEATSAFGRFLTVLGGILEL